MDDTILVVDDEEAVRELLAEILTSAGYTVFQASSGADALKVASEESIDCLLTDLGMSPMSGWELAREIKSLYDIPVILVTGWAGEIDAAQARENKVDRVISKPFDPEELLSCITELCSGER